MIGAASLGFSNRSLVSFGKGEALIQAFAAVGFTCSQLLAIVSKWFKRVSLSGRAPAHRRAASGSFCETTSMKPLKAALRAELGEDVGARLERLADEPTNLSALQLAIVGGYYTDKRVRELIGYPGQMALELRSWE